VCFYGYEPIIADLLQHQSHHHQQQQQQQQQYELQRQTLTPLWQAGPVHICDSL
jgi:hypothetical protein